ncbi:universal stress protein [Actinomycetospora cinnamomea]|uniref:Nucleotide-binding universal stress UspA family protein n=1 Tax=Actinomycetospora cinnamomea TaxID=663609 RepID=A0A2U1EU55_9PSEU|nr:universal stress protein [Actinomycetospora cinnamomea]PVZ03452.1 nucleotide-binding universal stress UspA family protein [Actinomycetospora cinnamomea]
MTVVVGRRPREVADGAERFGTRLARALGARVVLCTVSPPGEDAPVELPPVIDGVPVEVVHVVDRSVPGGLARAAHTHQAEVIVLGDGPPVAGTVGARLARAADVAVALAGTSGADGPITRVTCAFGAGRDAGGVLAAAASLARRTGASLRVASFGPQRGPTVPPEAGLHAERVVVEQWREQVLAAQREVLAAQELEAETLAAADTTVEDAVASIGWDDGDVLVVGTAAASAAARLLLGDPGAAVLRAAPVPVILAPSHHS